MHKHPHPEKLSVGHKMTWLVGLIPCECRCVWAVYVACMFVNCSYDTGEILADSDILKK